MELVISRMCQYHLGLKVALKDQDDCRTIAIINGNDSEFLGPIVLFNLDQHIIYGLSHPEAISKILLKGPQNLVTTKEVGHNLFEHGMKASLGKLKVNMNYFTTSLDTFYMLTNKASCLTLITGKDNQLACLIQPRTDLKPILISNSCFMPKETENDLWNEWPTLDKIEIENIQTYVTGRFKPAYGHTTTK